MPIYSYQCRCGKSHDKFHKVNRIPKTSRCECGRMAMRIIARSGAIQCDSINDVKWLPSALMTLPDSAARKITSRTEHQRYLKESGLVPKA